MSGIIWPNHLAAIHEIVWRARELVTNRIGGDQGWFRTFEEGDLKVAAQTTFDVFSGAYKHSVYLSLDVELVYRGDGSTHNHYNLDLLVDGRDALRQLMVLDDLGDIR